jgi:hypothetical protein
MTTVVDSLVEDYLGRLHAAAAVLPPEQRADLLDGIREHIADARAAGAAADEATVRTLLDRLGTPEEIVAAAAGELAAPAAGPVRPSLAVEGWAVGMLTVGGLIPFVGWLIGVGLLWWSRRWTRGEKLLGTLVMPLGPLGFGMLGLVLGDWQCTDFPVVSAREVTSDGRFSSGVCEVGPLLPGPWNAAAAVAWGLLSVGVAALLLRRAVGRRRLESPVERQLPAGDGWTGLELGAVALLAAGGFLLPVVGAVGGLVLAVCSRRWRAWEKAVAALLVLAGPAVSVAFYVTKGEFPPGGNQALLASYFGSLLLSVCAALLLGLRLRART